MRQPLLTVSYDVYEAQMRRIVDNFDPHLEAETMNRIVNDIYGTLFEIFQGDGYGPDDALLVDCIDALITFREERGMPRFAEVRSLLLNKMSAAESFKRGREIIERERKAEGDRVRR